MVVFFRNIHADTVHSQLKKFIVPALKGGWFRACGEIKGIKIVALRNRDINLFEYHGLVNIEPDKAALRVIKKLHGQSLNGKRIVVRPYIKRKLENDKRRTQRSDALSPQIKERRKMATRRRNLEVIEMANPGYGLFRI